jgi:eukaryotic-like serine/threonine-protein kinase
MNLPARIGKYELEEYLGGGMSEVYRARDTLIGRTVALKILTEKGREDGEVKARFLAEARTAGNISHENILGIYDFGEDDQHRPFMVMEFLRGEDLRHAIKNGHTGDLRNKLRIALEIARALEYIHAQKIVHRDLKPENVHISQSGQVKLMDFGISKREGLDLTRTGFMVGTPYYMAPEQVTGGTVTGQTDVYAFGILLYELIAGVHPVAAETMQRIFYAILNEPLDAQAMRQAGAPEELCLLACSCAAKEPSERPQGFGPVTAELERILAAVSGAGLPAVDAHAATLIMPERQPEAARPAGPEVRKKPTGRALKKWIWAAAGVTIVGAALALRPHAPATDVRTPMAPAASIVTPTGEMVLVPAGPFLFGEKKEQVSLPAFYIDRAEVTNAAYRNFSNEQHRALPPDFPSDRPNYPVVNVTIDDTKAFAAWAGKRLPTAREWEKAARGVDGRLYPWGNEADPHRANVGGNELRPAADFKDGASPYGALQMVGNVWEFVDETAAPSSGALKYFQDKLKPAPTAADTWYWTRGEAFDYRGLDDHAVWDGALAPARWRAKNLGFRCVRDVK